MGAVKELQNMSNAASFVEWSRNGLVWGSVIPFRFSVVTRVFKLHPVLSTHVFLYKLGVVLGSESVS